MVRDPAETRPTLWEPAYELVEVHAHKTPCNAAGPFPENVPLQP